MKTINKYVRVWLRSSLISAQTAFENRMATLFFIAGKFFRFFFFLFFIMIVLEEVGVIAGYTKDQLITFFLVFNLFDLLGQIFYRGVYWFRQQVVNGEFDFRLMKPISSLFQALTRATDFLDLPLFFLVIYLLSRQPIHLSLFQWSIVILISVAAFLIITAVHIFVVALGVVTTEIDHAIMVFRDVSSLARFPIDIYSGFLRALLTFILPIGLAYTFPAKALLGLLSLPQAIGSLLVSCIFFYLSLITWKHALKQYTSASS